MYVTSLAEQTEFTLLLMIKKVHMYNYKLNNNNHKILFIQQLFYIIGKNVTFSGSFTICFKKT